MAFFCRRALPCAQREVKPLRAFASRFIRHIFCESVYHKKSRYARQIARFGRHLLAVIGSRGGPLPPRAPPLLKYLLLFRSWFYWQFKAAGPCPAALIVVSWPGKQTDAGSALRPERCQQGNVGVIPTRGRHCEAEIAAISRSQNACPSRGNMPRGSSRSSAEPGQNSKRQ